jgi:type IV secretion system protein VirB6
MVFAAFIINMLFIPTMTQAIFGGGAGATGSAQNLVTRVALAKFRGGK